MGPHAIFLLIPITVQETQNRKYELFMINTIEIYYQQLSPYLLKFSIC